MKPADRTKSPAMGDMICVGAVAGARGLQGEVWLKSFTVQPCDIGAYGVLYDQTASRSFELGVISQGKSRIAARIKGVNDRCSAEALKGLNLYAPRAALPELGDDEYYQADLIGMTAELTSGEKLGTIKAVHNFGGGPILEIAAIESMMVPFNRQTAPLVDLNKGRVVIDPPSGLLAEAKNGKVHGAAENEEDLL